MADNFNKQRIIKNSLLLYVRMLFTMWLNLYATRLTLENLGIEDMGVYGIVGSIVSLAAVLTSGITNTVQRFITYELGGKEGNPNNVFCSSLNVIFILSAIVLLLLEVVGLWMLKNKVNLPVESINAAFWVFQLSIFTCIINLISIPYNALVIAHEKMNAFAGISVLQVILTCASAYCLSLFADNRLLIYGIFITIVSVLIRIIYQIYCHIKFKESKYHFAIDRNMIFQIGKFTGYSTVSGGLQVLSAQGIVFVINWTFGVTVNAVYNIALQLKNAILSFSLNLYKAISPQITKTYASGEIETHKKLVYSGSKLEVYMIYFIMIPFLFNTEYIMHLWLGKVPPFTVEFAQCMVFLSLTYALFEPIRTSVLATNRISKFLIIPECYYLLVLPVGYVVSKITDSPVMLIICIVLIDVSSCVLKTYYAVKVSPLNVREIILNIVIPCLIIGMIASFICYLFTLLFESTICGLLMIILLNGISLLLLIYFIGLSKSEKLLARNLIAKITIFTKK